MLYDVHMATAPARVGPGTSYDISIGQLSERINRRAATIRMWEHEGLLPEQLRGLRDARGWRWWSAEQVEAIREWSAGRYPGSSLSWYHPTRDQVDGTIERMRKHEEPEEAVA